MPIAEIVAEPLALPHVEFVVVIFAKIILGSEILSDMEPVHPLVSVTVTV